MDIRPNQHLRYTGIAILLHWSIAAGILLNLITGLLFGWMQGDTLHYWVRLHASIGITILALTAIRILWRLTHRPPPILPMKRWERWLAHPVHFILYASMITIPLTGWVIESSFRETVPGTTAAGSGPAPATSPTFLIWNMIAIPKFGFIERGGKGPDGARRLAMIHDQSLGVHLANAWLMVALLVLHVAGALKHQFIDRERELARMGVGRVKPRAATARSDDAAGLVER